MQSCIYEGRVRHRRRNPVRHQFTYRLCLMYLDLDELPEVFGQHSLWSLEGRGLARLPRSDHLKELGGDPRSLGQATRQLVARRIGRRPTGPIRLLTSPEYYGYRFNPVSFYYCFERDGKTLDTLVAEINNTPWGQQHCYVLDARTGQAAAGHHRFRFRKDFHVSPFMGMDVDYDWRFGAPGEKLAIHMDNREQGRNVMDVTMALQRREITRQSLGGVLWRHPLMTARVIAAIYWQAARLWIKKADYYPHPNSPWVRPRAGTPRSSLACRKN